MIVRFVPLFVLQIFSNALWAFWALPAMGEEGTPGQVAQWLLAQSLVPVVFCGFILKGHRHVYWVVSLYALMLFLFGVGTLGWALIGIQTPPPVYWVSCLYVLTGFLLFYQSLKSLGVGQNVRKFRFED